MDLLFFTAYRLPPAIRRLLPGLLILLVGCQTGARPADTSLLADTARDQGYSARLSLFLNLSESETPGVRLEVSNLEVFRDNAWLEVSSGPLELDSEKIGSAQLFLGGRALPPGRYQRLRLTVNKGLVHRNTGKHETVVLEPFIVELELPSSLRLEEGDSRSLFLIWDVQETLEREGLYPVMAIAPQLKQLLADLVYVACPDIDTLFVIRSDKNWVADSFGIRGRPTYLAMDPNPNHHRLLVLSPKEPAIKVVDLSSQRVVDSFHLQLIRKPTFMTISPDGEWAYVLEEDSSHISRIDLTTGGNAVRVRLGYGPRYAEFLPGRNLLAVSSGLSQAVLLLHPMNLSQIGTILTGDLPQGLLVSKNQLYIAESGDHAVSIFDLATLRNQNRLDVGFGPYRLAETDSYIYVSNYDGDSLSVLYPGQLSAVRDIPGLARPSEMVFDKVWRQLYVGEEKAGGLAVIDAASNQIIGRISFGARPLGLAVLP